MKAVPKVDVALPQKNVTTFSGWEEPEEETATEENEDDFPVGVQPETEETKEETELTEEGK